MLALLDDGRPQKSGSHPERITDQRGEAAKIAGRVGESSSGDGNRPSGTYLNPSNRPVRTAGDARLQTSRPYADSGSKFSPAKLTFRQKKK
jgi:hypothetical protein